MVDAPVEMFLVMVKCVLDAVWLIVPCLEGL